MPKKEILIYSTISSWVAQDFINAMNDAADSDVCVRINSDGGSPEYGFGMIAKFSEHPGNKLIKVDGKAHSMLMFFLCYADDSEALNVSEFLVHRAAYPDWFESNPTYFTEDIRANVERTNEHLRKAFEAKIDVKKFEELKGVKVKDIFSMDQRLEVVLTAVEAKKIGLINRVINITPQKTAEIKSLISVHSESNMVQLAAFADTKPTVENKISSNNQNQKTMNLAELKANYPDLFAQVVAMGVANEKERVEACLTFIDVDQKGVLAAIASGKPLGQKELAEFSLKAVSKNGLEAVKKDADGNPVAETEEQNEKPEATAKAKAVADFTAAVGANLGLKK